MPVHQMGLRKIQRSLLAEASFQLSQNPNLGFVLGQGPSLPFPLGQHGFAPLPGGPQGRLGELARVELKGVNAALQTVKA